MSFEDRISYVERAYDRLGMELSLLRQAIQEAEAERMKGMKDKETQTDPSFVVDEPSSGGPGSLNNPIFINGPGKVEPATTNEGSDWEDDDEPSFTIQAGPSKKKDLNYCPSCRGMH
jgi:hypothetical protein